MQIAELPLNALISIDFDAVDECGPGTLYSILDINTLQLDLPKALGPEQMVDVLVATSTSFCMVDGDVLWPSTDFPSCTLTCAAIKVSVSRDTVTVVCPDTCVGTVDVVSIGTCGGFWDLSIFDRRWRWWQLLRSA